MGGASGCWAARCPWPRRCSSQPATTAVAIKGSSPLSPADLDSSCSVGIIDFLILLASWGPCPGPPAGCPADLDGDGVVGSIDLGIVLTQWSGG